LIIRNYFLLILICFATKSVSYAQNAATQIGARPGGLGYASASLFDEWGVFNNIAGTAKIKNASASFTYDLHPALQGANRTAATLIVPLNVGIASGSMYRFGDDLYNEQLIAVGFANKFGLAALGTQIKYIQYRAEGFGSKGVWSLNIGGIAELTKNLSIGAYIINLTQPKISDSEKLPTKLVVGIGFSPIEKIFIATEIEKDLDLDPIWKTGIEYKFHPKFCARTGYNIKPDQLFFGIGFNTRKIALDYAVQHNALLGMSHQASVRYQFQK
jgi:hypothetical protein